MLANNAAVCDLLFFGESDVSNEAVRNHRHSYNVLYAEDYPHMSRVRMFADEGLQIAKSCRHVPEHEIEAVVDIGICDYYFHSFINWD